MTIKTIIRKNEYYDSVFLMNISEEIQKVQGVKQVTILMGTDMNKTVLEDLKIQDEKIKVATPNDLIIVVEAEQVKNIQDALLKLNNIISQKVKKSEKNMIYPSLDMAFKSLPDANIVFISVPGEFATNIAKQAIVNGIHTFIFSDNVPLSEEVELKKMAREKGILVMGPGCGTSVVNNVSLGLMSSIRKGTIGIVGASGSGIHEIAVLIDRAGLGISQAIGTGGRDLSDEVGGITMIQGLNFLIDDEATEVIVLVSKPPGPLTLKKILKVISTCKKPVVINFIGGDDKLIKEAGAIHASTLEDTALRAISLVKKEKLPEEINIRCREELTPIAYAEKQKLAKEQRYLRGLFFGGTHCEESILILQDFLNKLYSNCHLQKAIPLPDPNRSCKHSLIDMGAEEFTKGKPHPVIDPSIIKDRLWKEGSDANVAVILLDILLGYGAHEGTLKLLKDKAKKEGRHLSLVASICGTDKDPQNLQIQKEKLKKIGVIVMPSNAQATILSRLIVS